MSETDKNNKNKLSKKVNNKQQQKKW